tara:strand:- start:557 stop:778 length:222 start_codon:yes stop_codon:yes gene_type:complete
MKKVIVRTHENELTSDMWHFGCDCANLFISDLKEETYDKGWNSCAWSDDYFTAFAYINKNGSISVCVTSKKGK